MKRFILFFAVFLLLIGCQVPSEIPSSDSDDVNTFDEYKIEEEEDDSSEEEENQSEADSED